MSKTVIKKYFIFQEGDDIMLAVNASSDEFDRETLFAIFEELKARKFESAVDSDIAKLVAQAERGEIIRIGGYSKKKTEKGSADDIPGSPGEKNAVEEEAAPVEIEISQDKMQAKLIAVNKNLEITEDEIRQQLGELKITNGINDTNIELFVRNFPLLDEVVVAEGSTSQDGEDAEIELVKEIKTDLSPETMKNGRADFKKLNLISPVKVGDKLQLRTPPTKAVSGYDIFCKELKGKDGKDIHLLKGENTVVSKDRCSLEATEEGFLYFSARGAVNVRAVYIVNGDVDYHTGNVEYKGDVIITKDVRAGFTVKAGAGIHIRGSVEDSKLEAKGDLQIDGGVRSSGGAMLKAGGDVKVGFCENCRIEAGGDVEINREAINCDIRAEGNVEVLHRSGRIIGGHIKVKGWIAASMLGSQLGGPMELALEPNGWEKPFKTVDWLNDQLLGIYNVTGITDEDRAAVLQKLAGQRVDEAKVLDSLFARSFVSAKSYQAPVNIRCGSIVHIVKTDLDNSTFYFKDLEIRMSNKFLDKTTRDKYKQNNDEDAVSPELGIE